MKHLEGEFQGYQNINLYYQCWLPDIEPGAVLLIVHGLADHSGRFANLINHFVPRGYAIYGYDQWGHGRSPGQKGYIDSFAHFVDDLGFFLRFVRSRHPDNKVFIVAHSVGGTVATAFTVAHQDEFDGLILSAATLKPGNSVSGVLIAIAPLLSLLVPKMGLYTIDAPSISRDQAVVNAYVNDPLVYRGKIRTRLGVEILRTMQALQSKLSKIRLPVLIMYGTADRLSEPEGSQMLYDAVSSSDKTLKTYDGFYHEIFNQPGHEQVLRDVEKWLTAHL